MVKNRRFRQGDKVIAIDKGIIGYITNINAILNYDYILEDRYLCNDEFLVPYSKAADILYGQKIKKGADPDSGGDTEGTDPKTLHPSKV